MGNLLQQPGYSRGVVGLGANGWGPHVSMVGIGLGGAFAVEVLLTYIFVTIVLVATSRVGSPGFAGLAIGIALTVVHLIGIPLTGTSVNPARSLGPALILGHKALAQVWLFIVAPLSLAGPQGQWGRPWRGSLDRRTSMIWLWAGTQQLIDVCQSNTGTAAVGGHIRPVVTRGVGRGHAG